MNERFRFDSAYIIVLFMLLHSIASHCRPEFVQDTISNQESVNYVPEDSHNKVDPSIERIFRSPIERTSNSIDLKPNPETDFESIQETNKHIRTKRESTQKKNTQKALNEATKSEQKRSPKSNKASSRSMRSSRDSAKLSDKRSSDYDVPADQESSEYVDEAEEEPETSHKDKESGYRGRQFHVAEDSDRFIDQEERSSLYDDFETKEVAKRGISGSEDYEELEEEALEPEEDAALDEQESQEEEDDRRKVHGDTRVKREHDGSKDLEAPQSSAKLEESSSDLKSSEASLTKDGGLEGSSKAAESKADSADPEYSKRSVGDKQEAELKSNSDVSRQISAVNDAKSDEGSKTLGQESQEASADRKAQDETNQLTDKTANQLVSESSGPKGSKVDDMKVADVSSPEASKVDGAAETAATKDVAKVDALKNDDSEYEKRVEEQIQRKIDSIKEEIKREIEQKQRIKEIEANNAKFDELHELEEEEEEQAAESEPSEKQEIVAKRSMSNPGKIKEAEEADKRSAKRRKRQNDGQAKAKREEPESSKKSIRETGKKRTSRSELAPIENMAENQARKQNSPREVFLVRNERTAGRKGRRRRSKSAAVPEERSVKAEESLPADAVADSGLKEEAAEGKMNKDEKAIAEQDSLTEKKSGSVASLTGNGEELGPLATEYGDAFGGLNNEPGVALARFKRIKRVLRPQSSKT